MNFRNSTLTILLALYCSFNLSAQDNEQKIINNFFSNYEKKGIDIAVDELYKTNPWTTRIQDAINNVKTQLSKYDEELVGKYYGYERIVSKQLGNAYILHSYMVRFDRQPLRFTFQFYKPDNEWRLHSFAFDDSFDDEIEESAKLYNID